MGWNYRVLAHKESDGDHYFQIHEVYYDGEGNPDSYTKDGARIGGDSIDSLAWSLTKMNECMDKPILSVEDFPNEFKIEAKKKET